MREPWDADGDQDLNLCAREMEDVLEIMEDPVFKGDQNFKFEMDLDEAGRQLFGGEANAGVAFQIGQLRCVSYSYTYVHVTSVYIHVYIMYVHYISCMYIVHTCIYMYVHCSYMYIPLLAVLGKGLILLQLSCKLMEVS